MSLRITVLWPEPPDPETRLGHRSKQLSSGPIAMRLFKV